MKHLHETNHWIKTHGDLALDMVRIYLGIGLMVKAVYFMTHSEYLLQLMPVSGSAWLAPAMLAHYIILAHFFGGLLLTVGLITRLAAAVQLPILMSAILYVHLPRMVISVEARESMEFAGLVFFLLALISVYGAGRWSLDYWLAKEKSAALFRTKIEAHKPA
jgi:putative oxidoreductase